MNCAKARAQFSAYVEQELSESDRRAVSGHLGRCEHCSRDLFAMQKAVNESVAFQRGLHVKEELDAEKAIKAEGCDIVVPKSQGCCGALSVHNGREAEGQAYARKLVDAFEGSGVEYVVVNSAGCGSTMKEYAALLADDPAYADRARAFNDRVRDVAEILDELGPVAPRHPLEMTGSSVSRNS